MLVNDTQIKNLQNIGAWKEKCHLVQWLSNLLPKPMWQYYEISWYSLNYSWCLTLILKKGSNLKPRLKIRFSSKFIDWVHWKMRGILASFVHYRTEAQTKFPSTMHVIWHFFSTNRNINIAFIDLPCAKVMASALIILNLTYIAFKMF